MVTLTLGNCKSQISGLDRLDVVDRISLALSYKLNSAQFSWAARTSGWDGRTRLLTSRQEFPTGCLSLVEKTLKKNDIEYTIEDKRVFSKLPTPIPWIGHKLYPYQEKMVQSCIEGKHGLVRAATGAGKTLSIGSLISKYNEPTAIFVISLDLLDQMREELEESLDAKIGVCGDGNCDIQNITVFSVQTAARAFSKEKKTKKIKNQDDIVEDKWNPSDNQKEKIRTFIKSARVVIMDEAQFAAAESIKFVLENSKNAPHRFGFTATPWRTDGDDILLEAAFGPLIFKIDSTELIEGGYLVPPKIIFKDIPRPRVPIERTWASVKSNYIVDNPERNAILIRETVKLLEAGRKPLLLFRDHKHGKILESMLPDGIRYRVAHGKLSKAERKKIRAEFEAGEVDLLIASTIFDQGINLPALDALVVADPGKSTSKALQRIGRVIRSNKSTGKKDAWIVEVYDQCHFVDKHSLARLRIYQTERAFRIKMGKALVAFVGKKNGGEKTLKTQSW